MHFVSNIIFLVQISQIKVQCVCDRCLTLLIIFFSFICLFCVRIECVENMYTESALSVYTFSHCGQNAYAAPNIDTLYSSF